MVMAVINCHLSSSVNCVVVQKCTVDYVKYVLAVNAGRQV